MSGRIRAVLAALLVLGATPACVYLHVTEPLDVDLAAESVPADEAAGDTKHVTYFVSVEWDGRGIGEIAEEHGLDRIRFADLETFSVLGVWTQQHVHLYGTKAAR